jgi:Mn2+/Fe2+ NRAMP family transporter
MKFLRRWKIQILLIFAVVGPGFITANVDNDANGIWTYSQAGAQYGYSLLWTMLPTVIVLIVIQEMSARMGAVTGKGLSDLIREEYGIRITFLLMVGLILCNCMNIVGEFSGIAGGLALFGVSKYISVPIGAALAWLIVVKGQYKSVEKVFIVASFFYVTYLLAGFLAKPDWPQALHATVAPPPRSLLVSSDYLYLVIGLVGTTIAPWMQFYLQASIVEKGVTRRSYGTSRLDVIIGCIFAVAVAWFIVVACSATLYVHGYHEVRDGADAAQALGPLAGKYAFILFALGLLNASLFAAAILPLSTAYTVCEGLGFESGVDKTFREAPVFYWLYTLLIAAGAAVILVPDLPLVKISIFSQVINGMLLPFVLVFMLLLINKKELMDEYVNTRAFNVISWIASGAMVVLTIAWFWMTFGHHSG